MKKRLAVTLIAVALSVVMLAPAYADAWRYVNGQWEHRRDINRSAYKGWVEDNGNWHYMSDSGVMTMGWQRIDGQWYCMDQAGVVQKGQFRDNDEWYFLLPNGAMATNTTIDGRQIGVDGAWIVTEGEAEPANIANLSVPYLMQNLLNGPSTRGYSIITSGETSTGEHRNNVIRLRGKRNYIKYAASGRYRPLSDVIAPSSQFSSGIVAKVTVHDDNDTVLCTSQDIHHNERLMRFGMGVTGQNKIRVEVSLVMDNGWDDPIILVDGLSLYKQAG